MTNHSSSKAAVVLDPNDGYDHLVGVLGGRLIERPRLAYVDPFEKGGCAAGIQEMTPRTDAEED